MSSSEISTHQNQKVEEKHSNSATGTRTRVARVRAEYPNQLDYSGSGICSSHTYCRFSSWNCSSCQMHQPRIGPMLAWQTRFVIPGNGVRKSPRKKTIRNVISLYIRNYFFRQSVCKTKMSEREIEGSRKRVESPACGGGVQEEQTCAEREKFFFRHTGKRILNRFG